MDNLINLFTSIHPISKEEKLLIEKHTAIETFSKKDFYNEEGKTCRKLGFVEEGVFKVSSLNSNGDEYIKYFVSEGHFTIDIDSFFNQTPSTENIVALTPCKVLSITHASYLILENEVLNFSKIVNELKQKALLAKFAIKNEMLVDDAITRYTKFTERHPSISQRISQRYIALHLGISEYTLSRIRAQKAFLAI